MGKYNLVTKEYADATFAAKNTLNSYIEKKQLNNVTGMRIVQNVVAINNANFFDIARNSNEYILPLFFANQNVYISGIQYSNSTTRFITNNNLTGYYNFWYIIIYIG